MSSKMMFVSLQIVQIPCCFFHHHHKGSLHSLILLLSLFLSLSCNRNYFYITSPCSVQVLLDPQNKQLQIILFSTGKIRARRNFSLALRGTAASPLHSQKSHYWRDLQEQPNHIGENAIIFKRNGILGQPPTRQLKTAGADECRQILLLKKAARNTQAAPPALLQGWQKPGRATALCSHSTSSCLG